MKRHMKLIALILHHAEEFGNGRSIGPPELPGYKPEQVLYHIGLCSQAGFLVIEGGDGGYIRHLTWDGHEFLASNKKLLD